MTVCHESLKPSSGCRRFVRSSLSKMSDELRALAWKGKREQSANVTLQRFSIWNMQVIGDLQHIVQCVLSVTSKRKSGAAFCRLFLLMLLCSSSAFSVRQFLEKVLYFVSYASFGFCSEATSTFEAPPG